MPRGSVYKRGDGALVAVSGSRLKAANHDCNGCGMERPLVDMVEMETMCCHTPVLG